MNLHVRLLELQDIEPVAAAFAALGWDKPASQYVRYLADQTAGERVVLVAFVDQQFAGYVTVRWHADYPAFRAADIPEIQDFNVLPIYRRQGIGTRLLDEAEQVIAQRSAVAGIGVGLFSDYGAAQRLYVRRGYIPDGRGIFVNEHCVQKGERVVADDDLVLYFTKTLA